MKLGYFWVKLGYFWVKLGYFLSLVHLLTQNIGDFSNFPHFLVVHYVYATDYVKCDDTSWKFLAENFRPKGAQLFGEILGHFEKLTIWLKTAVATIVTF